MQGKKSRHQDLKTKPVENCKPLIGDNTPVTNGQSDSDMPNKQMVKHSDSSEEVKCSDGSEERELAGKGVETGAGATDSTPQPDSDQYKQHQEAQTSLNNTDTGADDIAVEMPPVPSRQRSAFSVAKKRPPGESDDDDDDSDEGKDLTMYGQGDSNNNNSPESQPNGNKAWETDMANVNEAPTRKSDDGQPNEKMKQYEEGSDLASEGPSREESIDIPMAYDNQVMENGSSRKGNSNKGGHSSSGTPQDQQTSKIPRSLSNDQAYFSNNSLSPKLDLGKKNHSLASLLDGGAGRSPDEDAKSSFSGKSTLIPR
jgi:hypothetical protein